ncbi:MAG: PilZ domain-containing protein [Desulfovibrio sp.]|nr:PilZ domain-containing protein [Desulfovibrio sp.]
MRSSMSRFFRNFGLHFANPSTSVTPALEIALEQRALFQLEVPLEKDRNLFQHLNIQALASEEVILMSPSPFFTAPENWEGKTFRFRFLTRPHPSEPPQLHMFKGKITRVGKDAQTISVTLPKDILIIEQRRNVRIKPVRKHLPQMVIWGVHKDHDATDGVRLNHRVILELNSNDDETAKSVKNISAGGIRLTVPSQILSRNKEWLGEGRKLIVQLVFQSSDRAKASRHMYVAKIVNARTEGTTRPEFGIQFLASRVSDPNPRWKKLEESGCEDLARLIQAMQVQYHTEAKQIPTPRGGGLSTKTPVPPRQRGNA